MADQQRDNGSDSAAQAAISEAAERAEYFRSLTATISHTEDTDILFFGGDIAAASHSRFITAIRKRKVKRKNVLLLLTTVGGDPHCAYRIVKRLQQSYSNGEVTIFVHSTCASAGTLMVIGGNNVVMSDSAELGPLDIQLAKTDDLVNRMSGLTPTKAMATLRQQALSCFEDAFLRVLEGSSFRISVRTASDIAVQLTTGLYQPIYSQIDPFRLGEVQRDNEIAFKYGQRLDRGNLRDGALHRLINEYPAHEFIINREEASEHIFHRARSPSESEVALAEFLEPSIARSLTDDEPAVMYLCLPLEAVKKEEAKNEDNNQGQKPKSDPTGKADVGGGTRPRGTRARNTRTEPVAKDQQKNQPKGAS